MLDGTLGLPIAMLLLRGAEVTPHTLVYVTLSVPLRNALPNVTVMLLLVLDPVALAGSVQLYVPAPPLGTLYVWLVFGHTLNTPLIAPITDGLVLTAKHLGAVLMQLAFAVTHMLPLV